ncbi:MAG: 16S rRNA (cytosine(1402)-N(4))-methyltransferase RsmH [Cellvibrionales bacterium]|nr:16S rRNA (cytosine(1402)-N(4))-methyltransferase RsmH [Cellvibrionales bacterium]
MHESVLLQEAVAALSIKADGFYVDGTFGRGGHSRVILESLSDQGRLLAIDKDNEAISYANATFGGDQRFLICHGTFASIQTLVESQGKLGKVDGVLLDLGVSSPQLDVADRGFSFLKDGPLDMRMNDKVGETAADWLQSADQSEIRRVFWEYGEEKFSGLIAKKIVERRVHKPFETTLDLANFIKDIIPNKFHQKKHPATRCFQAIRMHINNELGDIEAFLSSILSVLKVGGRLVVISFHSLEDRLIKRFIKNEERGPQLPKHIPIRDIPRPPHFVSVGKAIKPSAIECEGNVRARSAVMRIAEKVAGNQIVDNESVANSA